MDMPKLLIADNDDLFRQLLADSLAGLCLVRTCATGRQALEQLLTFRPDILIVDLLLPEIDGISLLHRAEQSDIHPAILTTSIFNSSYVSAAAARLGVHYMMTKPCDIDAIVDHVRDLAAELAPAPISQADLRSAVSNILLSLGFPTKLDGFNYLVSAIPMYAADPAQAVTKELYSTIGQMYNKDWRQVERSIRNAIDIAWSRRQESVWQQYFTTAPGVPVPRPTNRAFISRMAHHLCTNMLSVHSA